MKYEDILSKKFTDLRPVFVPEGDVGIEIELEGELLPEIRSKFWKSKKEGSLRGGMEYVSAAPLRLEDVESQIYYLGRTLMDKGALVYKDTYRTSTHIHVNYTKDVVKTIVASVILWALVEPAVLRVCGQRRDGNPFCLPTSVSYGHGRFLYEFLKCAVSPFLYRFPTYGAKYAALNTQSLSHFGSLEYRCFPASLDKSEVSGWCRVLCKLRALARDTTEEDLQSLILNVHRDPSMVGMILGSREFEKLLGPTTLYDLVSIGCRSAYELSAQVQGFKDTCEPFLEQAKNLYKEDVPRVQVIQDDVIEDEDEYNPEPPVLDEDD